MSYYPVFLDLTGRRCLVVGGGDVACGKIAGLLAAGAEVTVVSPAVSVAVRSLADGGTVQLHEREYSRDDMRGVHLAVAATADREVNRRVSEDAARAGALVNVVDDPELSSYIAPAVLRQGDLTIAVSTGGGSPAYAAYVRDRIGEQLGPEYGDALVILRRVRARLREQGSRVGDRKRVIRSLAEGGLVDLVRRKDRAGIEHLLGSLLGDGVTLQSLGLD